MSNEIKEIIDTELPPGTAPVKLDVEAVMRGNRNARMKRRLVGGGAAVASIVAVVALVLSVMTLAPEDRNSDDSTITADDPVIDPDENYFWWGPESEKATDASKAYTEAFWKYVAKEHPEVSLTVSGENAEEESVTKDFADYSFLLAADFALYEGEEWDMPQAASGKPVRERTVLTLFEDFAPDKGGSNGWSSCCGGTLRFRDGDDEKDKVDNFDIQVYPKGSFTKGTEDAMDPAFLGEDVTHDIETVTGPDGEDIQYVAGSTPDDVDGTVHTFERSAIVYRADGSAVAVRAMSNTDRGGNVSDNLSFEDLQGMALAMPDDPID
ncbi:hypothetical protein [Stackebrandtia nassauensis]|uniref:Uncharacterized protein n=1 Tax=Stackebrandtia nassauensis (strain DSM 44728 / CIP 108903 / NRRL B-16338 / NBRC 102104 / LLR-40K-21) TaxID=446470 RepID=D3QA43_STANL|nr:hypothetical protein [Stackebrandtia nassauensis]ADD40755.1 hypothetical protein Snas_1045 [Stackebrandtia nassauensis DSM 44728]